MKPEIRSTAWAGLLLSALLSSSAALAQGAQAAPVAQAAVGASASAPATAPLYATVNGKPVTQMEFHAAFANHMRQKFYHGQVPQDQLLSARKDVSDQLVNRILFLEEIERRGIQPDSEDVERQISVYDQRYAANANWQKSRETMLPGLRAQLSQQSRLARLEQAVRDLPLPGADEVKAFYAAKPELFTEPEKLHLRSILLAVEPSAARPVWEAAVREAEAIVRRIRGGADFAEQARMSSNDASAEKGGDMGYVHVGMLSENLQAKINEFKLGEVTDPIETLQGMVIMRLEDRIPPKLQPFERVVERARDLLHREKKDQAWQLFVEKLRAGATVVIHEAAPAPASATAAK